MTYVLRVRPSRRCLSLLVWGDALLVLGLGLDVVDGIRGLDLKGDGLSSESLDEDLHTTTEVEVDSF